MGNTDARRGRWVLAGMLLLSAAAVADEPPLTYDRVSLAAEAQAEVPNDLLTSVLYVQREGADATALADEVNKVVEWAVAEAKQVPQVEVRSLDYRTSPIYTKQTLTGWRVRQSIRLESADAPALSQLLGRLQVRMAVESITYRLSPGRQTQAENALIEEALSAFQARADLISGRLGRPGYRLVDMHVNTSGVMPRPMYRAAAMEMRADAAAAPPVLEPGNQTVQVQVSGTIELKVK